MFAIDDMAYKSPMRAWPPLGKLMLTLALLISSIMAQSPLVPLIVLIIGALLLAASSRMRLPNIIALACVNTFAMLIVSIAIIALMTPGTVVWSAEALGGEISITREAINLSMLILLRAVAGFSVLLFFASSTPIPHLFFAMRQIGLPQYLAELTVLIYRYSFMLLEQMGQMYVAADCRLGFSSMQKSMRAIGLILSGLFSRSMDFAERAQTALLCRNFKGEFSPYRKPAGLSAKWIVAPLALFIILMLIASQTGGWMLI